MTKELFVSSTPHETKVGLVEDDLLAEIYLERENEYTLAGSIYKGRVTRVLPGMQSAFVDIGLERDAFLYVSDFMELQDEDEVEEIPTNLAPSQPYQSPARADAQASAPEGSSLPPVESNAVTQDSEPTPQPGENRERSKAVRVAVDEETGAAVAVAGAVASACPNPSLPGPRPRRRALIDQKKIVPTVIVRKDQIVPKEPIVPSAASVPNMVRLRDTSRSCCQASRSRSISVWRRVSRGRNQGLPRRIPTPRRPSPLLFPRMSRCSPSRKATGKRRFPNLKTGPKGRPRMLKSDHPNGIANKSVCMK